MKCLDGASTAESSIRYRAFAISYSLRRNTFFARGILEMGAPASDAAVQMQGTFAKELKFQQVRRPAWRQERWSRSRSSRPSTGRGWPIRWCGSRCLVSAPGLAAVLALLRYSRLGPAVLADHRRLLHRRDSIPVWLMLGVLLLSVIIGVRLNVLFSYQGNDMYTALQTVSQASLRQRGGQTVRRSTASGCRWRSSACWRPCTSSRVMLDIYLTQRFISPGASGSPTGSPATGWTARPTTGPFIDDTIDNPDQRIQQDIDIFTAGRARSPEPPGQRHRQHAVVRRGRRGGVGGLVHRDPVEPVRAPDHPCRVQLPRAMFWIVLVYVLIATVVAFWIGRPLIRLSFRNEKFNAAFRYALVRVRDAAEAVAFYRGEIAERRNLRQRFAPVIDNYRRSCTAPSGSPAGTCR